MAIPTYFSVPAVDAVRAELIINCIVVFLVLSVVGLRVYVRVSGPGLGLDDMFVMIALPLGVGMLICQGFILPLGGGYNLSEHAELAANVPFILFMSFTMEIMYVLCLASAKASMLFFLRRVFSTDTMRRVVDTTLAVLAAWVVAFECACIFLCTPVSDFWGTQASCGAFIPMIQSLIATNAVGDLVVMCLPMPVIWSLQMRTTEKLGIMACFGLGFACIVIAIFRVIYLAKVDLATNVTGTMPATVFLFALEPNLAILCVSIPMLRPLYTRYRSRTQSSRLHDGSGSTGINKSGGSAGLRTIGMVTDPGRKAMRRGADVLETQWEMDDYYNAGVVKGAVGTATAVDAVGNAPDAGHGSSEKSLTKGPQIWPVRGGGIGVETKWDVTVERADAT